MVFTCQRDRGHDGEHRERGTSWDADESQDAQSGLIAAAEERGRRAGIGERDELRSLLGNHVQYLRELRAEIDGEICPDGAHTEWCSDITRAIERLDAALAPRDSGKEPAKMDAPGGPRCWCGRLSVSESGWCGGCESPTEPA